MATNPDRAMRPTSKDIDAANRTLLAMGWYPISGGEQTAEELAAEAAAKAAEDAEAAKLADDEKHLNDAGKEALRKEREARKAAAKRAADAEAELTGLRARQADADAAKAKAEEEDAIKRGEFEKIATERADALKAKDAELAIVNERISTLVAAIKPDVEAQWATLPDEITELFTGADDDVIGKRSFMSTHKKLIDALAVKANETVNGYRPVAVPNYNGKGSAIKSPLSAREIRGG